MLIRSLILLSVVFLAGCRSRPPSGAAGAENQAPAPAHPRLEAAARPMTVRIDPGGAKTDPEASPPVHRSVGDALRAHPDSPLELVLHGGTHEGPFVLPDGSILRGAPQLPPAVIVGPPAQALVRGEGTLTLRNLVLRGGRTSVEAVGAVELHEVTLEGQASTALRVTGTQRLLARSVRIRASGDSAAGLTATGLRLEGRATAELHDVTFEGPRRRAIEVADGATLRGENVVIRGVDTGVHQRGGKVRLVRSSVEAVASMASTPQAPGGRSIGAGAEAAFFTAGASLSLHEVRTVGHAYGVLTGGDADVEVEGLTVIGPRHAGLGITRSRARLRRVSVSGFDRSGGGNFAGIQLVGSQVHLSDLELRDVGTLGVSQRGGTLVLERATIVGVTGGADGTEGSGISVRAGTVELEAVSIAETSGPGVVVAESAKASGGSLRVRAATHAGVVVETEGALVLERLEVQAPRGPALVADGRSQARVTALLSEGAIDGVVLADCEGGAVVELGVLEGQALEDARTCVTVGKRPGASEAKQPVP